MQVTRNIFRIYPYGDTIYLSPIHELNESKEMIEIKSGSWVEIKDSKIMQVATF